MQSTGNIESNGNSEDTGRLEILGILEILEILKVLQTLKMKENYWKFSKLSLVIGNIKYIQTCSRYYKL